MEPMNARLTKTDADLFMATQGIHTLQTQDVVIDFLEGGVLAPRAVDGRKLPSGHEYAIYQRVVSVRGKDRSETKKPRS